MIQSHTDCVMLMLEYGECTLTLPIEVVACDIMMCLVIQTHSNTDYIGFQSCFLVGNILLDDVITL